MRSSHTTSMDTDGLQADVMRFMAIIAFCLIAILALVDKIEPTANPDPSLPQENIQASQTAVVELVRSAQTPVITSIQKPMLATVPNPEVVKAKRAMTNQTISNTANKKTAKAENKPAKVTIDEAPDRGRKDRALSLQFYSEAVFLNLIASGEIVLFARTGSNFQRLTSTFNTVPASPEGKLYEIYEASLPTSVTRLFPETSGYLVKLPGHIETAISDLHRLHQNTGGELIIQHNGDVIHEL